MKKTVLLVLVIGVCLMGLFAQGDKESAAAAPALRRYSIGTAGTAGSLYPMGVSMAETITKHVDGLAFTGEATAASVENVRNLTSGKLAMGISQSEIAYLAYNGLGDFAKRQADDLRSLFSTIYSYIQVFTLADSPINSIADFKGKAIGVGAAGSGGEMAARMILDYYGLSYDDIKPQFIPESEAVSALKDNKIAAFLCTHPLKSAALMDLTTSAKVKMISFEDPSFYEAFPFWTRYVIPAGTYTNVDEEVTVPISRVLMLTSTKAGLSEDDVYEIVKAIWENRSEWGSVTSAVSKQVVLETALSELSVPMHSGAIKYFKEKGFDLDASLYPPEYK
ncbi:MAG: TAXI family TRAP transporter solute-binding subunit [Sphaerochaeta sp.]|nr:TAXI family TRAP transporter solute-binding subunit [Sphaerochaeta sp.]